MKWIFLNVQRVEVCREEKKSSRHAVLQAVSQGDFPWRAENRKTSVRVAA